MKSRPTTLRRSRSKPRAAAAFTLAEVLAALAFMAIVIPTAVHGLQIANLSAQVALRKTIATRLADRVLSEAILQNQLQASSQNGQISEGTRAYNWSLRSQPWNEEDLNLVTVTVQFQAQGRPYQVEVSTLVDPQVTPDSTSEETE